MPRAKRVGTSNELSRTGQRATLRVTRLIKSFIPDKANVGATNALNGLKCAGYVRVLGVASGHDAQVRWPNDAQQRLKLLCRTT